MERIRSASPVLIAALAAAPWLPLAAENDSGARRVATLLGGSGLDAAYGVAVDRDGNVFVFGRTDSWDFPVPEGWESPLLSGSTDALIVKFDPSLERILAVRTLGGSGEDRVLVGGVTDEGILVIAGWATSGFPTTEDAIQRESQGARDLFAAALDGEELEVIYSTLLGGTGDDVMFKGEAGPDGLLTVTGYTTSRDGSFPLKNPVQSAWGGGSSDTFVVRIRPDPKLAAGTQLVYATLIGGAGEEVQLGGSFSHDVTLSREGWVTVTFQTTSTNLPLRNPVQGALSGGYDAFLAVLDPERRGPNQLLYSTYLGGSADDAPKNARWLDEHRVALEGWTFSNDFPRTLAASNRGHADVWVSVVDVSRSALLHSTTFGGSTWDTPTEALVTPEGDLLVAGRTGSNDFPEVNPMSSFAGAQGDRAFVFLYRPGVIPTDPGQLRFSSSYGGSGSMTNNDYARGLVREAGGTYLGAGYTGALDFPTTPGVVQERFGGGRQDIFVVRFDLRFPEARYTATPAIGPAPLEVTLDASASTTPPGTALTSPGGFSWTVSDGQEGPGNPAQVTLGLGRHVVTLRATNDLGLSSTARGEVTAFLQTGEIAPWRAIDIGAPWFPGGTEIGSTETFRMMAGGRDILGSSDQFHFLFQETSGPFVLEAYLEAPRGLEQAAAGLMVRASADAGSPHYSAVMAHVVLAPARLETRRRLTPGGSTSRTASAVTLDGPATWLRIERRGTTLRSWRSVDGASWDLLDEQTLEALSGPVLAGVCAVRRDLAPAPRAFAPVEVEVRGLRLEPAGADIFRRGNATADDRFDLSDAVRTLGFLFLGNAAPPCLDAADADDSGVLDLSDAVYSLQHLFLGGRAPPEPFEECGHDPSTDELDCGAFPPCEST